MSELTAFVLAAGAGKAGVVVSAFLASAVEFVEAVTIVLAMGTTRGWRSAIDLPDARFTKTFVKPAGTGHRKNKLAHGVCRVQMSCSTNAWFRTMAWIDELSGRLKAEPLVNFDRVAGATGSATDS